MFEMALYDTRDTNPHPECPLRKLADLYTGVYSDIPISIDHRMLVGEVLLEFLPDEPDTAQWQVWATVSQRVLTPRAEGRFPDPEDLNRISIVRTIVTPEHANMIHAQLWPPINKRLATAPNAVVAEFVTLGHEWLAVGGGYDYPFGQDHPQHAIERADILGRVILGDLIKRSEGHPELIVRLAHTASNFDIELPANMVADVEQDPFFRDIDHLMNSQEAIEGLKDGIGDKVAGWTNYPPGEVIDRLIGLRAKLKVAGISWSDRIWMACRALAASIDDPGPWVKESLRQGLFPEADPFLEKLIAANSADNRDLYLIKKCLRDAAARTLILSALLADTNDTGLLDLGVAELTADDYGLLSRLVSRGQLNREVQLKILRNAPDGARGAFVIAFAGKTKDPAESISDDLRHPTREAETHG